jgi:hypothetical protein
MMEEAPAATLRPVEPDTMSVFWLRRRAATHDLPKQAHLNVGIGYLLPSSRSRPPSRLPLQRALSAIR